MGLNGEPLESGSDSTGINSRQRSSSNSAQKRVVVGTLNNTNTGRKMLSPPANIFIYGVHLDTTVDDIVTDLADTEVYILQVFRKGGG